MKKIILLAALPLIIAFVGKASAQSCQTVPLHVPSITFYQCSDGSEYRTNHVFGTTELTRRADPPPAPYPAGGYPVCSATSGTPCRLRSAP